jgi:hypothetical protein
MGVPTLITAGMLDTSGEAGAPPALMRLAGPARYRGLRLGSRSARYANWHSGQNEILVPVGSNPTRVMNRELSRGRDVPWSSGDDTSLTKRKRGFDSLRDDSMQRASRR